jgi:hypothetical protein
VWGSAENPRGGIFPLYFVIDVEPEFMPMPEQQELFAQALTRLGLYHFFCRPAIREEEVSESVIPITIENIGRDPETDEYQFVNPERIAQVRAALESQSGIPVATVLKEQEQRVLPALPKTNAVSRQPGHAQRRYRVS